MSILNPETPSASSDLVALLNADTGMQMFAGARPLKVTVNNTSKFMAHPTESAVSVVDHKVDLPISIQIPVILRPEDYRNVYSELNEAKRLATRITVQTKTATHDNMFLEAIPREEDTKYFDTITMVIQLVQNLIAETTITTLPAPAVRNAADASTIDRGQQSATPANDAQNNQGSLLYRTFN